MTLRVCRKGVERMCRPGRYFGCVRNRKGPGQSRKLQKTKWNRWFWWICHNPIHGGCTMQALPSAEAVGAGGGADKAGQWDGMTEGYFKQCIFMTRSSVTWHVLLFWGILKAPWRFKEFRAFRFPLKIYVCGRVGGVFLRRLSLSCPFWWGGVAVLFAGSWRYEERTVATVARHVVMPLQAVVLAALSGSGPGRLEHWQMKRFFPALAGRFGRYHWKAVISRDGAGGWWQFSRKWEAKEN